VIPLFHRLRLSPVLGFMLVGVAVGPFGLAMLADEMPLLGAITLNRPETIVPIAELGISMMMFMIGLEHHHADAEFGDRHDGFRSVQRDRA